MAVEKWNGGKWRARWRDPEGRTQSKVFPSKALADKHVVAMSHARHSGTYIDPSAGKVTFEVFADEWCDRKSWRATTDEATRCCLARAYVTIGDRPLRAVRKSEIEALVRQLSDSGLAPSTVRATFRAVASVFKAAVDDEVLAKSPCVNIGLPTVDRPKVLPLESAQVAGLADAITPRLRGLVLFCAGSGVRISEALGVTVDRVDFLRKTLRVDRQLVDVGEDGAPVFGPCKTKASNRSVPLGQATIGALAAHLAEYPASGGELVFTPDDGPAWRRSRVNEAWAHARTKSKVSARGWHDLRHHFASVLIGAGCSIKAVQEALGHANASETLDTYSHLWPADEDRIRDAIDDAFGVTSEADDGRGEASA